MNSKLILLIFYLLFINLNVFSQDKQNDEKYVKMYNDDITKLIRVQGSDSLYGYIDSMGKVIIEPKYFRLESRTKNCIFATINSPEGLKQVGIFDAKGKLLVPIEYDDCFSNFYFDSSCYLLLRKNGTISFYNECEKKIVSTDYELVESISNNLEDNVYKVKKKGKYGVLDKNLKIIIPYEYSDLVFDPVSPYISAIKNGKVGLIKRNNEVILPFKYDSREKINDYSMDDMFLASLSNKFGIVSSEDKILIPFLFDSLMTFSKSYGKKLAAKSNNKWGIIDNKGKWIVKPTYQKILETEDIKFFTVQNKNKWGCINLKNQKIIALKYDNPLIDFIENRYLIVSVNNKLGILKNNNKFILKPVYQDIEISSYFEYFKVKINNKWGVLSNKGELKIPIKFDTIQSFDYNSYKVGKKQNNGEFQYGLFNKDFIMVTPANNIDISRESDYFLTPSPNLASFKIISSLNEVFYLNKDGIKVEKSFQTIDENVFHFKIVQKDNKMGLIDSLHKLVIPFEFEQIYLNYKFPKYLMFSKDGKKFGIMDLAGKELIPSKYDFIDKFPIRNKYIYVKNNGKNDLLDENLNSMTGLKYSNLENQRYEYFLTFDGQKQGLLDNNFNLILDPKYEGVELLANKIIRIKEGNKTGYLDSLGKTMISPQYNGYGYTVFKKNLIVQKNNSKFGLIDFANKIVIPFDYEQLLLVNIRLTKSLFISKIESKMGILDEDNKIIEPCEYDKIEVISKTEFKLIKNNISKVLTISEIESRK
jgi:hypothetical protein